MFQGVSQGDSGGLRYVLEYFRVTRKFQWCLRRYQKISGEFKDVWLCFTGASVGLKRFLGMFHRMFYF